MKLLEEVNSNIGKSCKPLSRDQVRRFHQRLKAALGQSDELEGDGDVHESVAPFPRYRSDNSLDTEIAQLRKRVGNDKVDTFLATLGMGPKYKPTPRKTYECPRCGKHNAYKKEFHPDTDMNNVALYCPDCKYSEDSEKTG